MIPRINGPYWTDIDIKPTKLDYYLCWVWSGVGAQYGSSSCAKVLYWDGDKFINMTTTQNIEYPVIGYSGDTLMDYHKVVGWCPIPKFQSKHYVIDENLSSEDHNDTPN